jgi:hypothetical protein
MRASLGVVGAASGGVAAGAQVRDAAVMGTIQADPQCSTGTRFKACGQLEARG